MRPSKASVLATLASTASAMSAPRPFLLLSTHKSSIPLSAPQYAAESLVLDAVKPYLSDCPTHQYLIVNQAGLRSTDIYEPETIPNLRRHAANDQWVDRLEIGEVHGKEINEDVLATHIRNSCPDAIVEIQYLHSLGTGEIHSETLADNDLAVGESISSLSSANSLTLIYFGGAVDADLEAATSKQQYVAEFGDDGAHIELKRQLGARTLRRSERRDEDDLDIPLPPDTTQWTWFQKNSWISTGQVAIVVTIIMIVFLMLFAIQQVTSIVVPYGSFDAEFVNSVSSVEKKKGH